MLHSLSKAFSLLRNFTSLTTNSSKTKAIIKLNPLKRYKINTKHTAVLHNVQLETPSWMWFPAYCKRLNILLYLYFNILLTVIHGLNVWTSKFWVVSDRWAEGGYSEQEFSDPQSGIREECRPGIPCRPVGQWFHFSTTTECELSQYW